jgi:hypothetical protein
MLPGPAGTPLPTSLASRRPGPGNAPKNRTGLALEQRPSHDHPLDLVRALVDPVILRSPLADLERSSRTTHLAWAYLVDVGHCRPSLARRSTACRRPDHEPRDCQIGAMSAALTQPRASLDSLDPHLLHDMTSIQWRV